MYFFVLISFIIIVIDLLIFKGPLLNGVVLIVLFFWLIMSLFTKKI